MFGCGPLHLQRSSDQRDTISRIPDILESMLVRSLILVGGLSTRMGTPKHALLQRIDPASQRLNQPLLVIMLLRHHELQLDLEHTASEMHIAVRDHHQKEEVHNLLALYDLPQNMRVHYVLDDPAVSGPAAGLLAAHSRNANSAWLVTGCDYPLLSATALRQLYTSHTTENPTLTCFMNSGGFIEPLLAIWSSTSLEILRDLATHANQEGRRLGPSQVIRFLRQSSGIMVNGSLESFRVNIIEPYDNSCLTNVNTLEEWCTVQDLLEQKHTASERTS